MNTTIVLVGTLDTKREEIAFLRSLILAREHEVIVADTGILGTPGLHADISRHEIAIAGGADIDTLKKHLHPHIPVLDFDLYINDTKFAQQIFTAFEGIQKEERR